MRCKFIPLEEYNKALEEITEDAGCWIDKLFNDDQLVNSFADSLDDSHINKVFKNCKSEDLYSTYINYITEPEEKKMDDALLLKLIKKEIGLKVLEGNPFTIYDITESIREWYRGELYHSNVKRVVIENSEELSELLYGCSYITTEVKIKNILTGIYHHEADDPNLYLQEIKTKIGDTNSDEIPSDVENTRKLYLKIEDLETKINNHSETLLIIKNIAYLRI
jgi:hypothetical protein